ncbi:MAG: DUF5606 domain-containing protein [Bacteroidales bacterium]
MDLSNILAISGKPGLYKNVAQSKTGVIVESIEDGKRFPAFAHERISSLAEISIFTTEEDVPLEDVLKKIYEKYDGKQVLDAKSDGEALKSFMEEVLPNYDKERVYTSDIKKLVQWYNILVAHDMLDFTEQEAEGEQSETGATEKQEPQDSGSEENKA